MQEGIRNSSSDNNVVKLDAGHQGTARNLISESCIRSLYEYYRGVMDIRVAEMAA